MCQLDMIKPQHEAYPELHSPRLPQILPDHRDLADPMSTQGFDTFTSLVVASHVLFMYDYALTFSKEIELFWFQDRWNWAFIFFIANRYIGLLGRIPEFFWLFFPNNSGLDNSWCSGLLLAGEVTMEVLQIIGEVVMTARVYAICNRDRRIVSLLVVAAVTAQGLYCVSDTVEIILVLITKTPISSTSISIGANRNTSGHPRWVS